jgi:hypothetical protein
MCNQHTTNWGEVQPCKKYFFVVFAGANIAVETLRKHPWIRSASAPISAFFKVFFTGRGEALAVPAVGRRWASLAGTGGIPAQGDRRRLRACSRRRRTLHLPWRRMTFVLPRRESGRSLDFDQSKR